jgi:hypothetical protein
MFFRPDQAREVFFACRDNDERLLFVSKVESLSFTAVFTNILDANRLLNAGYV